LANGATLAGHVELGDFVVIGGLTPVHQFVHIGEFAMIAGASALSQDIPPYCLAEGNRAIIRGLNLVGLRRHINREEIDELKVIYRGYLRVVDHADSAREIFRKSLYLREETKVLEFIIILPKEGIPIFKGNNF